MKVKKKNKKFGATTGVRRKLGKVIEIGEWQLEKEHRRAPGEPAKKKAGNTTGKLTRIHIKQAAMDKIGGATWDELKQKYGVSIRYLRDAIQAQFITTKKGREILKGVLLEGAITSGMHAKSKIGELNGMQAAVATGILTSKFIELDKHTQGLPQDSADLTNLDQIGDDLRDIRKMLGDGS